MRDWGTWRTPEVARLLCGGVGADQQPDTGNGTEKHDGSQGRTESQLRGHGKSQVQSGPALRELPVQTVNEEFLTGSFPTLSFLLYYLHPLPTASSPSQPIPSDPSRGALTTCTTAAGKYLALWPVAYGQPDLQSQLCCWKQGEQPLLGVELLWLLQPDTLLLQPSRNPDLQWAGVLCTTALTIAVEDGRALGPPILHNLLIFLIMYIVSPFLFTFTPRLFSIPPFFWCITLFLSPGSNALSKFLQLGFVQKLYCSFHTAHTGFIFMGFPCSVPANSSQADQKHHIARNQRCHPQSRKSFMTWNNHLK